MKRLGVFFDKNGRTVKLTVSEEIVWPVKTREVMRLVQQALEYYQEKRTAEIGERAFFEEIFQILTREGVSESRRELLRREFEKLGLLFSNNGEVHQGRIEQEARKKEQVGVDLQDNFQPAEKHREPQPAKGQKQGEVKRRKREPDPMLPNDILRWALGEND